jgi:SAM-dependent methyltransferase
MKWGAGQFGRVSKAMSAPAAPAPLTKERLQEEVKQLGAKQGWAHEIELPLGVRTRPPYPAHDVGKNLNKMRRLRPVFDALELEGKRVLDVACNEGFYSLEAARRGARVVGVDIDPLRIEKARFVKQALGQERVEFHTGDLYTKEFEGLGRFDVCFALGLLHRLPDPFTALRRISARADILVLEWMVLRSGIPGQTVAHYIPGRFEEGVYMNPKYWRPSPQTVIAILEDLGFSRFRLIDDKRLFRTILVAGRIDHPVLHQRRGDLKPRRLLQTIRLLRDVAKGFGGIIRGA